MAPTTTKPTVLILHGSWHSPRHWARQISLLEAHAYEVVCPIQPSFNADPPTTTVQDDAAAIQGTLSQLVEEEGKEVIVLMHSYGGMVGTEAVTEAFSRTFREGKGLEGGVVKLLYVCAFLLRKGECLCTPFGGELPPFIPMDVDGTCTMLDPQHRFYHDLPPSEQEHWAELLRPVPATTQMTALTNEAYQYVSASYLACDNDQALPVFVQERFVKNTGVEIEIERCVAGHSPFLSMPERVVEVVKGLRW